MEYTPEIQLIHTFNLQFYCYFGKLEGIRTIDEKISGVDEVISQERKAVVVHLKTLWEAFCKVVRKELTIEPEIFLVGYLEDLDNDHQLKTLDQMKEEMSTVEVDSFLFALNYKLYSAILAKGRIGPNLRLV